MLKAIRYIALLFVVAGICIPGETQDLPSICPGQTSARYAVAGNIGSTFQWDIPTNIEVVYQSAYGDTIEIDWRKSTVGSYEFSVSELGEHGCLGSPSFGKVTIASNQQVFNQEEVDICEGQSYNVLPADYSNVVWQDGSTEIPYVASSTEKVAVQVITGGACDLFDTLMVYSRVLPSPHLDSSIFICTEDQVYLDPGFFTSYEWSTGDITDQIIATQVFQDSTVWVKVYNEWGCMSTDTTMLLACNVNDILNEIPNTFNPRTGSRVWKIGFIEKFPGAKIEIFDRWGRLVFSTNDASSDFWDGTYNGNLLPADSYYYVIDLNAPTETSPVAGNVNIIY